MERGLSINWIVAVVFVLVPAWAWGATPTMTRHGVQVRWNARQPQFVANPENSSGLSAREVFLSFTRALQRWRQASQERLDFQYWQGTAHSVFAPESGLNGYSAIYFASQADPAQAALDSSILGLTQVWFDSATGEVLEADIILNDRDHRFGPSLISIDNVITHELGHAFGLAHSAAMQSTMFFAEGPDQAYPGCDDQVGIARVYPHDDSAERGAIEFEVRSPTGLPMIGAQVHALSRSRGVVFAGALSDARGRVSLSALEPGVYDLLIEPYHAGAGSLPEYYRSASYAVCSGKLFSRTWPGRVGNELSGFRVEAGRTLALEPQVVSCAKSAGADIEASVGSADRGTAPILNADGKQFSWLDRADVFGSDPLPPRYFVLQLRGSFDLKIISFSAYSPVRVKPTLSGPHGDAIRVKLDAPIYRGDSGFVNHDLRLRATDLEAGEYRLELRFDPVPITDYPAGAMLRDHAPFFVLIGSAGGGKEPPLASVHPMNSRCRQRDAFPEYRSPPGSPPRRVISTLSHSVSTGCAPGGAEGAGMGGASGLVLLGAVLRQLPAWVKRLTLRA